MRVEFRFLLLFGVWRMKRESFSGYNTIYACVEVAALTRSILTNNSNSESNTTSNRTPFSIPELDVLSGSSSPTILELISPPHTHHPSGAGKTSLLYLIIAQAILPPSFPSIPDLNGHDAAIILFDPLHHFSIPRLSSVILHHLVSKLPVPIGTLPPSTKADLLSLTTRCLDHVHIFHPSSWASLLNTLTTLPDYLLSTDKHRSAHRRVHSLVLDDIDAFTHSLRSAHSGGPSPLSAAARVLTRELQRLMALLSCHAVVSSESVAGTAFRPALPVALAGGVNVVRLAVRRVEVLKFAPEMSVEQAEAERGQRWEVVKRGRFECWRVGVGGGESAGDGFVFRVGERGVEIEREDGG